MASSDAALLDSAQEFATDLADLLDRTVTDDPPIRAEVVGGRVVVAAFDEEGNHVAVPLQVAGQHQLDLRVSFRCIYDFSGAYLAIEQSEFALLLPRVRHPIVRFDYVRSREWASVHVQLHAESSAVGYLRALAGKTPETWRLHLPVGGRRFRPSLEDVLEFIVHEFGVDPKEGWAIRLREGRARWRLLQVKSAIRDAMRDDPARIADELRQSINDTLEALNQHSEEDQG